MVDLRSVNNDYSNCCNDQGPAMGQTLPLALYVCFLVYSLTNSAWYLYIIPILTDEGSKAGRLVCQGPYTWWMAEGSM